MYGIIPYYSVLSNTTIQHIFVPDEEGFVFFLSQMMSTMTYGLRTWWSEQTSFHLSAAARNQDTPSMLCRVMLSMNNGV